MFGIQLQKTCLALQERSGRKASRALKGKNTQGVLNFSNPKVPEKNLKPSKSLYICDPITTLFNSHMNKAELISKIAEDAGITKVAAAAALESFQDGVTKTLKKGDKLTLVGFGTFSVSNRAARTGRNPFNGETIKIKAKKVAKFKASKDLSGAL
jgi:DNA-binding protein HU-beta